MRRPASDAAPGARRQVRSASNPAASQRVCLNVLADEDDFGTAGSIPGVQEGDDCLVAGSAPEKHPRLATDVRRGDQSLVPVPVQEFSRFAVPRVGARHPMPDR